MSASILSNLLTSSTTRALTALSEPEPPSPPPPAGALIPRANHQHRATAAGPGPRRAEPQVLQHKGSRRLHLALDI